MSCPNFETQSLFPLYVIEQSNYYEKHCDECDEYFSGDEYDECPYCGSELGETYFSDALWEDDIYGIQYDLKKANEDLKFFEIDIVSGYWADAQLIVRLTKDADYCGFDIDGDMENVENDDTHWYFNCCRSECIRKFMVERNKVLRIMKQIKDEHYMTELKCCGIFNNGEAIYYSVDKGERERLTAMANAI